MWNKLLFKQIDNAPLIVFRILFGLLIVAECFSDITTGWVKRIFIDPKVTFSFIGFEWLQPLPGYGMYYVYAVMAILGLFIALGYRYKLSLGVFALMWTATYLMHKASYNNHYYFLILLCLLLWYMPANAYASLDAKRNPSIKNIAMPRWCSLVVILQMWIVYFFASVAKIYPDWINGTVAKNLMAERINYPVVGQFFQLHWFQWLITYSGIAFDFSIVPLLLFKKSRKWAFAAAIFFHIFNSFVFHIGIFPYLSLGIMLFFFDTQTIRDIFLRKKPHYMKGEVIIPKQKNIIYTLCIVYFAIQLILPVRHWFIKGNVLWTEEGHRLSWRMMLRSRSGYIQYKVIDKTTGRTFAVNPAKYLTPKQQAMAATRPDIIWQFSQYLKKIYAEKGEEIAVYVDGKVSVNKSNHYRLINPKINLAAEKWNYFMHNNWILTSDIE
ncbi:HTTM domain-containing protein [Zhouia sp. PK063]|uniref:HTTM domain-containing protein n=1 Tax=Zhouia sp. PK063 TaxID=3373602 RepID=UPI0037B73089